MRNLAWLVVLGLAVGSTPAWAGKKKKKNKEVPKITGWHQPSELHKFKCWYPKDYEALGPGDRKMARMASLNAMMSQWQGERGDGVKFGSQNVTHLETVLLGQSEKTEQVSIDNRDRCIEASKNGATIAWGNWLTETPARITEGECKWPPLDYQLFDYLDIGQEWQIKRRVCKGDQIKIIGSMTDEYRIREDGPWVTVEGDPADEVKHELPCNIEGCVRGMLIMRFVTEDHIEQVIPIGAEKSWTAPNHGEIMVMINDDTWYDNEWRVVQGIQHHASITYQPTK